MYAEACRSLLPPSASLHEQSVAEMGLVAEIACVLTISEGAASALLQQSRQLTTDMPLTLTALEGGSLSWQHARIFCDETTGLGPAGAAALEAHFLDPDAPNYARGCPAGELVPSRFRTKARTWRERHHPASIEKRHAKGVQDRRLEYAPDRDGTAEGVPSPAAQVLVTVPVFSLLGTGGTPGSNGDAGTGSGTDANSGTDSATGTDAEPAVLDGYGPIPASMARRLIADGADSFHRVLTDPRTGAPLEIGRTSYSVPKTMRQWLRLRDSKCPFPGCNNHSLDNEADHLLAWADGGTTGISNLGQPCRKHHRLKHTTGWHPTPTSKNEPPGWTSPTGRTYASEQQDWEPPHWPDEIHNLDAELPKDPSRTGKISRPHSAALPSSTTARLCTGDCTAQAETSPREGCKCSFARVTPDTGRQVLVRTGDAGYWAASVGSHG